MQEQYLLPGACEAGRQTRAVIAIMLTPPSFLASEDFSQITTDLEFATLTATYDISCQSTFIRHKCGSRVFFFHRVATLKRQSEDSTRPQQSSECMSTHF